MTGSVFRGGVPVIALNLRQVQPGVLERTQQWPMTLRKYLENELECRKPMYIGKFAWVTVCRRPRLENWIIGKIEKKNPTILMLMIISIFLELFHWPRNCWAGKLTPVVLTYRLSYWIVTVTPATRAITVCIDKIRGLSQTTANLFKKTI